MNYDLVKQLYDAGFSQPDYSCRIEDIEDIAIKGEDGKLYYTPTLAELINACGDITLSGSGSSWIAFNSEYPDAGYELSTRGSTPEEAVAKLWLELNNCLCADKHDYIETNMIIGGEKLMMCDRCNKIKE